MKKTIACLLALMMCLSLCACSGDSTEPTTTPTTAPTTTHTPTTEPTTAPTTTPTTVPNNSDKKYPTLDDIEIYYVNGISYNEPAALMGYTNNSSFTIVSMKFDFTIKADATEEELSVFDSFVADGDLEEEKIPTLTPYIYNYMVCDSGETVEGATCYLFGSTKATNAKQCELFVVKSAKISFLGDDGLIYTVAYLAENDAYSLQKATDPAKTWTVLEFAATVPKPDTRFITVNHDMEDYYQFTAYDITYEQYRSYCEECQSAGFTNEIEDNIVSFWCTNDNGLTLNIKYIEHMNALIVYAEVD